jgi:NADH:ubiquinone oxidoreductase subunit 2 (subunit N)
VETAIQVVAAAVDAHSYALAAVAMASGAIAAFFYLRVAIAMYSPAGASGDDASHEPAGAAGAGVGGEAGSAGSGSPAGSGMADPVGAAGGRGGAVGVAAPGVAMLSLQVLTDEAPSPEVAGRTVPVPALAATALGLAVAFTVVFGIVPAPIVDFAHRATLLFL